MGVPPKPPVSTSAAVGKASKQPLGFKYTTKKYEPDLSDEALEKMVPPPKRTIKEDTLVAETAAPDQSYSLANYSYRQGDEKKKESSPETSPRALNSHKGRDHPENDLKSERPNASPHESPKEYYRQNMN